MVVIPARGGSKTILKKNIKSYLGKPLICHSIDQSLELLNDGLVDDVVLTTDSAEIATVVRDYSSKVWIPFYRPASISEDLSTDLEFFDHLLEYLDENHPEKRPDILIHLRPTYPYRSVQVIKDALLTYSKVYNDYDCLRTVFKWEGKSPLKMFTLSPTGALDPLRTEIYGVSEPYNMPRQILPEVYSCNGYLDIIKRTTITEKRSVSGIKIFPWKMTSDKIDDIDDEKQWAESEQKQIMELKAKELKAKEIRDSKIREIKIRGLKIEE